MQYRLLLPALTILLSACGGGESSTPEIAITSQAIGNGTVSPTKVMVKSGQATSFTILPQPNHVVEKITGCNGSLQGQTYTTGNITAPCTVNATFELKKYTLKTIMNSGGSVTPVSTTVRHGERATLDINPDVGYAIDSVNGCGGFLNDNVYTTAPLVADCEVTVNFVARQVNVTMQVGAGGKASINTQAFALGAPLEVLFTPDSNYLLTDASGCDGILRDNTLKIKALKQDCTISARFHSDQYIVFADENLDRKVRETIGAAPTRPLTEFDIIRLYMLDADSAKIKSLRGIEQLKNLTILNLGNNDITDIYPLRKLANIFQLDLSTNIKLNDIAPLSALTSLKVLDLAFTDVSDLSPLQALPIDTLDINSSKVKDILPLRDLPLKKFIAPYTNIADLSPLADRPLFYLNIDNTKVKDLSMLRNLVNLSELSANNTEIDDIRVLLQSKEIHSLSLAGTKMVALDILNQLKLSTMSRLSISGCLDTKGYSKHLEILKQLAKSKSINLLTDGPRRTDCPASIHNINVVLDGAVKDRQLSYNWKINGSPVAVKCAVFINMEDQFPEMNAQNMQDCDVAGERIFTGLQADQFNLSMLFDNGLGGEKLVQLTLGSPPATPKLQAMDLSQITISSRPLLTPLRDGLLRLHVTAAQNPATLPKVTVQATRNGQSEMLTARAPVAIPTEKVHRSLNHSYQVIIPAALMQEGLELTAMVDGQVAQRLTPKFAKQRQLSLRIVPLQVGDNVANLPEPTQVERWVKTFWPIPDVTVRARAPYVLSTKNTKVDVSDMLDAMFDLRMAEGEGVYYYGYYKADMTNDRWSGFGYMGFPAAVGVDTDSDGGTLAHELGHNFNRSHVNCGKPNNPDADYPYEGDTVGSVGLSLDFTELKLPGQYKDLMSYCGPRHVSDYNVAAVQQYLDKYPPLAFSKTQAELLTDADSPRQPAAGANMGSNLYIAGQLRGSAIEIRTMLPLARMPQPVKAAPEQRLTARVQDMNGRWSTFTGQFLRYGHGDSADNKRFMLELPHMSMTQLELWQDNQLLGKIAMTAGTAMAHPSPVVTPSASASQTLAKRGDLTQQINITERSNEVCVNWPAAGTQTLSLIHQTEATTDSSGTTVMALNETSARFCRPITELPNGGQWHVIWRDQLQMRMFTQPR